MIQYCYSSDWWYQFSWIMSDVWWHYRPLEAYQVWGGYSHTWAWQGGSTSLTPIFEILLFDWVTVVWCDWLPRFTDKFGLSLSHLVPEIFGSKVGVIFHQNVLFEFFKFFLVSISSLIFLPFSLDLFDPSFLQNLISDWVQFCIACWIWLLKIWWSTQCPFPQISGTTGPR